MTTETKEFKIVSRDDSTKVIFLAVGTSLKEVNDLYTKMVDVS